MTNVPTDPPERELTGYAVTAAELHRIADALNTLPPGDRPPYVQLSILPEEKTAEAVDAIALAVLGRPGETRAVDGKWRRIAASGPTGHCYISILATVPGPPDGRDAEIARLKAELAKAQAHLGTNGAVADAKPDTLLTGFSGRAAVPDPRLSPTYCSALVVDDDGVEAVCGEGIYWDRGANAWWHQDPEARFKHTATGPSVPPQDGAAG